MNTPRTDVTTAATALALCLFFVLGLIVLTGSVSFALASGASLAGALVLSLKMLAPPADHH